MNLFKEVADIKTADQLNLPTPEVEYHNIVAQDVYKRQEVGGADEHLQSSGRGNPDGGAYQQLTLNLFLSEAEQIQSIDEAENVAHTSSAFSFAQNDIDHVLRLGCLLYTSRCV